MRKLAAGVCLLGPTDYRRMRWKNGRGWTTEIAVSHADAGLNGKPFDWRISMADIEQDGDFSAFPGYDRTILVAAGRGMELSFDAAPAQRLAERYLPFRFRGEWRTHCRLLHGPLRDFNVMTARSGWQHECHIARDFQLELALDPGSEIYIVYCFQGSAELAGFTKSSARLQQGETLVCINADLARPPEISASSAAAVLAIVSLRRVAGD